MAKISVSIAKDDVAVLRRRAKSRHRGNLSAAVAEATDLLRHLDAMQRLLDRLGAPHLSPAELEAVDAELLGAAPRVRPARRKRAA